MTYNGWKMMDKIDVAIRTKNYETPTYNGFVVEHGDKEGLDRAKKWATTADYDYELRKYTKTYDPEVHTFNNEGFTVRIIKSADGSSQGGRLSFLACEIEKDGIKFIMGVNDELLIDLIKNSEVSKGLVKEKVMFVRKGGQPGFIHEGMEAYKDAMADMKKKSDLKKAKKTKKWEIGGVYSTLTQKSICIGEVWDYYEEKEVQDNRYWYDRTRRTLVKREKPVKVLAWMSYSETYDGELSLTPFLKRHIENKWNWFETGEPPARAKSDQLTVSDEDLKLIEQLLSARKDTGDYSEPKIKGRYRRVK